MYESIFPDLRSDGKILRGVEESEFEVTSGPIVWAEVTQVPLASASHL